MSLPLFIYGCAIEDCGYACEGLLMREALRIRANIYRRRKSYYDRNYRKMLENGLMPKVQCMKPGCTSTNNLEYHHKIPLERDGRNELDNIMVLCHYHHEAEHRRLANV